MDVGEDEVEEMAFSWAIMKSRKLEKGCCSSWGLTKRSSLVVGDLTGLSAFLCGMLAEDFDCC